MQTFKIGDKVRSAPKEVEEIGWCWHATVVDAKPTKGDSDGFRYETVGRWRRIAGLPTKFSKIAGFDTMRPVYAEHLVPDDDPVEE